ncbi:MAG: sugar transferase [Firmicutes bacterium]|nr:sugar transferase [Bacillota bacterium]
MNLLSRGEGEIISAEKETLWRTVIYHGAGVYLVGSSGPKRAINYLQMLGDVLLVNLAIVLSFWIRFHGNIPQSNFASYISISPFISVIALLIFNFYGLYHTSRKSWGEIAASIAASIAILTPITIAASYMSHSFAFPRTVFLISAVLQLSLIVIWRWVMLRYETKVTPDERAMVVAPVGEMDELLKKIENSYDVYAMVTDQKVSSISPKRQYGIYADIERLYHKCHPSVIFVSSSVPEDIKRILTEKALENGCRLLLVPSLFEIMLAQSRLGQIEDTPVLEIGISSDPGKEQTKRFMDIVLSFLGLVVLSPIMLVVAIAIKLDSPGPVFYRQERISQGGRRFMVVKFRTMTDGAENNTGPVISQDSDPRVTRVGRILRATRFDEVPQLFNVLNGDMSIVGPRPERPFFVEQFEKEIPEYSHRHMVKAGITGLAQVAGRYSTSPEDKLKYDLLYARSASPLMDLRIMLQTLKVILMREKAS